LALSLVACSNNDVNDSSQNNMNVQAGNNSTDVENSNFDEERYLKDITIEVVESLSELASNEEYIALMTAPEELAATIDEWKTATIDESKPIVIIPAENKDMESYLEIIASEQTVLSDLLKSEKEYILTKIGNTFGTMINGRAGVKVLAASSVLSYSRTYVPRGEIDNQIWFIPTNQDVSFYVSFMNTGDGAITVNATYVVTKNGIKDTIESYLGRDRLKVVELSW
jgi:hypothetical protein